MIKRIVFDRITREYIGELNGEIVCFCKTWQEASDELDRLVYEQLKRAA